MKTNEVALRRPRNKFTAVRSYHLDITHTMDDAEFAGVLAEASSAYKISDDQLAYLASLAPTGKKLKCDQAGQLLSKLLFSWHRRGKCWLRARVLVCSHSTPWHGRGRCCFSRTLRLIPFICFIG